MEFKDYYKIMGVSRDASQEEIKRAYRRLARKYHPDVSKEPDAEQRFKEVGEAYEVLSDPEKRSAYDTLGQDWKAGQQFRPPPNWEQNFDVRGGRGFGGFSTSGGFSDFFDALFGGGSIRAGRGARSFDLRGDDLQTRITLTLDEAYRGTTKTLNLQMPEIDNAGVVRERTRALTVRIPAGATHGQRIRLPAQGGAAIGSGRPGDLYATVELAPHPFFKLEDRDVLLQLPVTPWEAALGATIKVPTLGGAVDLKVPKSSRPEQKLRLKGRGLPGNPPGDQLVTLQIVAPPATSAEAEQLYQEMAAKMPFNPRGALGV